LNKKSDRISISGLSVGDAALVGIFILLFLSLPAEEWLEKSPTIVNGCLGGIATAVFP